MAFTKNRKGEMTAQYEKWLDKSQAVFVLTYERMNMKRSMLFVQKYGRPAAKLTW